jgi:hypothetical protein
MSFVDLNTFKEIHFWNCGGIVQYYKIPISNFIFSFQHYALSFLNNTGTLYDDNYNRIANTDEFNHGIEKYDTIYVCPFNQKLMVQFISNDVSYISIYNTDFSRDILNHQIKTTHQIIYLWNNLPYTVAYSNQRILLHSLDGVLYRVYDVPFKLVYISNFVCFKKGLYGLGKLFNNNYVIIKCGKKMKYTNYFSIDYTFQFLSVDFENDLFKIHLLSSSNDNNLMVMSMLLKDLLVHEQRVAHANAIPDFQLLPTNILEKIIPKQLKKNELQFDISKLKKLDDILPKQIKIDDDPPPPSKIIQVKSSKYFDYFKWIVDNYDSAKNETVIFFKETQYNLQIEHLDNIIVEPLQMGSIANNFDIFIMTLGKIVFSNQTFYIRKLKKQYINERLVVPLNCANTNCDYYQKYKNVSESEMKQLLRYIFYLNIPNNKLLLWTPFQYFKLNMKLIWNRPKIYWENIYNKLNTDFVFETLMPFLFYNIIKG